MDLSINMLSHIFEGTNTILSGNEVNGAISHNCSVLLGPFNYILESFLAVTIVVLNVKNNLCHIVLSIKIDFVALMSFSFKKQNILMSTVAEK